MQNPNIRGSGYIEHPPQVPFAGKVVMQPSTVDLTEETPEWFAHGPRAQRPMGHPPSQQAQRHVAREGYTRTCNHSTPTHQSVQTNVEPRPGLVVPPLHPQKSMPSKETMSLSNAEPGAGDKKLSKAARAKLRKKMREGKI